MSLKGFPADAADARLAFRSICQTIGSVGSHGGDGRVSLKGFPADAADARLAVRNDLVKARTHLWVRTAEMGDCQLIGSKC